MVRRSLQDWASISEMVGALAIVITLIYVAYELRENTRAMQVTSRQALSNQDLTYFQTGLDSAVIARAMSKYRNGEDLTDLEIAQLEERQHLNFRVFEHAFSLRRSDALDSLEWKRYENVIRLKICGNRFAQSMWSRGKKGFDNEFMGYVETQRQLCTE